MKVNDDLNWYLNELKNNKDNLDYLGKEKNKYLIGEIILVNHCFFTKDNLYSTKEDSKGYSYWYDGDDIRLGHLGYDYVFATEKGKDEAIKKLNDLIKNHLENKDSLKD